jgi:uncharacterized membrane protein YgdD (TMEM256/DUF423 family)
MTARACLFIAAVLLAIAVALGAFGAHALKSRLTADMLAVYQTAVQYHAWHALGLLATGVLMLQWPESTALRWSAGLLLAGVLIFSGSLYGLALSGVRWLGAVTPIGGAAFIAGWLMLALAVLKR